MILDPDTFVSREEARVLTALDKILAICDEYGLIAEFTEDYLEIWDDVLDVSVVFFDNKLRKEGSDV